MSLFKKKSKKSKDDNLIPDNKVVKGDFEKYRETAINWELHQYKRLRAVNFILWIYTIFATIAITALALAIVFLTPLKEKEPYLIRVDSSTGIAETLSNTDLQNAKFTLSEQEALDRYFLAKYVIASEGYNYALRNENYAQIAALSNPVIADTYRNQVTVSNPDSPINKLGRNSTATIHIRSISFPDSTDEKVAYIRFIRIIKNVVSGEEQAPEYFLATVNFSYLSNTMTNDVRQYNPLGFFVTAYNVTKEVQ